MSAKISKNTQESRAGLQILTISAVKATGGGDTLYPMVIEL
jgi:hypothetical protein